MRGVVIRGLHKEFDGTHAVDGVDLAVDEGELLVLLGPSGCGKTTLLRMIAGLEAPTAGEIYIAGDRVDAEVPPRARRIAMVFQSYALYPHRSVFANISFPLEAAHTPRTAIAAKVQHVAEMFGVAGLLRRFPRQLSGGERQRVALCRAVVRDPRVFLLDEPLSNLDAKLRTSARDELKQFQRRVGVATIYVTHDQVEAMGLGDRIAVMDHGRVRQVGTPQEIYDDPADTFVATFVGQPPMNLIPLDGPTRPLLGFRPEQFLPRSVFGPAEDIRSFGFQVRRVEYLGSDRIVYGSLPGVTDAGPPVIAKIPNTIRAPLAEGDVTEFAVPRRELRTFDRDTGRRRT